MLSQMSQQQATSTTNICEPAHNIINPTSAAGDLYINHTNSKSKCMHVTKCKMTLTTNVCDTNHIPTIIDVRAS